MEKIGFDLFPMVWERVERLAKLEECLTPLLANVRMLYCSSEEDKKRFENLQIKLSKNLQDTSLVLDKAYEKMDMVLKYYQSMLFEDDICELRTLAGQIITTLSDSVAYANHLSNFKDRAIEIQNEFVKIIKENGISINEYDTAEEFMGRDIKI